MAKNDLARLTRADALLTASLPRLLTLMRQWWDGQTLLAMAALHGISRQRVHRLLARVACNRRVWCKARRGRASARRASEQHITEAVEILSSPLSVRLTTRQRCALCWQAMGLVSLDIAARMAARPSNVRRMLAAARWRMERLKAKAERSIPIDDGIFDTFYLEGLLRTPSPSVAAAPVESQPAAPDAAPHVEFDEPDERAAETEQSNTEPVVNNYGSETESERVVSPPEIAEDDLGPPSLATPRLKLSDLQRAKRGF